MNSLDMMSAVIRSISALRNLKEGQRLWRRVWYYTTTKAEQFKSESGGRKKSVY